MRGTPEKCSSRARRCERSLVCFINHSTTRTHGCYTSSQSSSPSRSVQSNYTARGRGRKRGRHLPRGAAALPPPKTTTQRPRRRVCCSCPVRAFRPTPPAKLHQPPPSSTHLLVVLEQVVYLRLLPFRQDAVKVVGGHVAVAALVAVREHRLELVVGHRLAQLLRDRLQLAERDPP